MTTRVFVGRLNYDVRERDLEKFFKGYGRIGEVLLKNGYGFVEFDDYRDAEDAVHDLNGKKLMGERISVELARGIRRGPGTGYGGASSSRRYGPPSRTEYQLLVENLSSSVSWQDLKDFMRQAGEVTYTDAHKLRRNEGVVEFATYSDMKNALIKLNHMDLDGRRIRLIEAKRLRRSGSRSRSRSRSRPRKRRADSSRSNSRSRSRSYSRSRSPPPRRRGSRSESRSRSRSKPRGRRSPSGRSHSRSRSRSSPRNKSRSVSKGRDEAKARDSRSKSRSRSRSTSKGAEKNNRSRSKSPAEDRDKRSRSRSASPARNSTSKNDQGSRSRSRSSSANSNA
ncbi:unnamed protein product [Ixodes hexagonus]